MVGWDQGRLEQTPLLTSTVWGAVGIYVGFLEAGPGGAGRERGQRAA